MRSSRMLRTCCALTEFVDREGARAELVKMIGLSDVRAGKMRAATKSPLKRTGTTGMDAMQERVGIQEVPHDIRRCIESSDMDGMTYLMYDTPPSHMVRFSVLTNCLMC